MFSYATCCSVTHCSRQCGPVNSRNLFFWSAMFAGRSCTTGGAITHDEGHRVSAHRRTAWAHMDLPKLSRIQPVAKLERPSRVALYETLSGAEWSGAEMSKSVRRAEASGDKCANEKGRDIPEKNKDSRPKKRRGRDSNPRYRFTPYTGLANRRIRPLCHLSQQKSHRIVN